MTKTLYAICLLCICGASVVAQVNLSSGLMAYYPFNGTFNDASGNGNHAAAMNGASFGTDRWGNPNNAAFFDGINDWISVPAAQTLTPGRAFSMAFRFQTNSTSFQVLFSKSNYSGPSSPNNLQYQFGINGGSFLGTNALFFSTNHNGNCMTGTVADNYVFGVPPVGNQWYCVVATFDKGVKNVYVNGMLINTDTISAKPNNTSIDSCIGGTFRIGTWWQNDPLYYSGLIDEVRIWNRAINAQEIDSVCNLATVVSTSVNGMVKPGRTLLVYPNPASGDFLVVFDAARDTEGTLTIRDMLGQTVLRRALRLSAGPNELHVSSRDLPVAAGVYTVQLSDGEGMAEQQIIIK